MQTRWLHGASGRDEALGHKTTVPWDKLHRDLLYGMGTIVSNNGLHNEICQEGKLKVLLA